MNILRTGILLCLLTISCASLTAQCSTITVNNNLLLNGDFEITGPVAPPMVNWTTFGAAYQTPFPPQFATFQNSDGSAMAEGLFQGDSGFFQDVPMGAGVEVTAGMWISHSSCGILPVGDLATVSLEFYDAGGGQISFVQPATPLTNGDPTDMFMLYQVTATTPPGTASVRVVGLLVHNNGYSAVNYDDAFLVLGDATADIEEVFETEPPALSCGAPEATNLVATNATFDTDLSDWNQFTEFNTGFNIQYDGGNQYASIFGGFTHPVSNIASITYAIPAPAAPGETFQACMDLSSIGGDFIDNDNIAYVELQFLDGGGTVVGTNQSALFDKTFAPDVPVTVCVKGVVPAGAVSVTMAGVFDQMGCGNGSVKFDNAVLSRIMPIEVEYALDPGECDIMVLEADLPVPCATDNCGVLSITSDFVDQALPIGVTTVNWTAEDVNGNISMCSYDVTVVEFANPGGGMSCNDNIQASLDGNCEVVVVADMILEGDIYGCYEDFVITTSAGTNILTEPGTYGVTVTNEIGNACWATIHVEDKLKPELECDCPPGAWMTDPACQINCDDVDRYLEGRRGIPTVTDNCADVEAFFGGAQIEEIDCGVYILTQAWVAVEEGYPDGQIFTDVTCIHEYYVTTPSLDDELECPEDVIYDCTESGDESLFHPDETGYPEFGRQTLDGSSNSFCSISAGYDDVEIPVCGDECYGPVKILRNWSIIDWCTLGTATCTQVIKIVDSTPPTIIMDDVTVSTGPWECAADIWFEDPQVHDDCDYDVDWFIAWTNSGATLVDEDGRTGPNSGPKKHAIDVPKGIWTFAISAVDCCGNVGTLQITVTVLDKTPPVPVAIENIVVSLTSSGDDWDGTAKILVESVDNGSHDNCSDVWIELRRESDPCDIDGNLTYSNKIPEICDPWYDDDDHDYGQHVKFCCNDLTEIDSVSGVAFGMVKVWMRVWDDGNMDGVFGSYTYYDNPGNDHDYCEIHDNYNEIWAWVRVEDKAPVALLCPPDVTIPCHWDYTDLTITGEPIVSGSCDHPIADYVDWPEIHCGEGYVLREWSVPGENYVCVQRITLEFVDSPLEVVCPTYQDFDGEIWFDPFNPNHVSVDCMDFEFPEPWQSGGKCSLVGVNESIDTFWFEQDACFKAIKTWHYVDWCTGEEAECEFVVSLVDSEPPVVMCQDTCFAVNDYWDSDNDGIVCEMTSDVNVTSMAMDSGDCGSEWIKWVAEVDLWYDGVVDLTYSSFLPHNSPYYIAPSMTGSPATFRLDKDDISAEWARHAIQWKAFDGCGNFDDCIQYVEVADKKAPTPYCVGISTALMSPQTGNLVELWAKDFNLGSYDNCTPEYWLQYTFNGVPPVEELIEEDHCFRPVWEDEANCVPAINPETGLIISEEVNNCNGYENGAQNPDCPLDGIQKWSPNGLDDDGNPCKTAGLKFSGTAWCGENIITISVWDKKLNMDYCAVDLVVHGVECGDPNPGRIAGIIATETGSTVDEVIVTNSSNLISGGSVNMLTASDGFYAFDNNILGGDYAVTADKNDDYLNGVSTLDLVLIQKHILGLDALESGYKMVAADINNDEAVSAVDLVELRKLILGIYSTLPDNSSWRFIDGEQSLNVQNPWPLTEEVNISNLSTDMMDEDFVAIKIGDVNDNVTANFDEIELEERSNKKVELITETLPNGSIAIKAGKNFTDVYGYQFTINAVGTLTSIEAEALEITEANFGVLANGNITTSYASGYGLSIGEGTTLFVMNGLERIDLVDGYTKAEAYQGSLLEVAEVSMREDLSSVTFALAQNKPNPFSETTRISFTMGETGMARLSVMDVNGKIVKVFNGTYETGNHIIEISKESLGGTGVFYYKLESGTYTATRKMILID